LRTAIKKSLGIYNVVPSLDFEQNPEWSFSPASKGIPVTEPKVNINPAYNPFEKNQNRPAHAEKVSLNELYASSRQDTLTPDLFDSPSLMTKEQSLLRLSNGRWIIEKDHNLWLLDPYRIHQTVLYENHLENFRGNALSQQLLFPLERPVYDLEKEKLDSIKTSLFAQGFDMDIEEDIVVITAIPSDIPQEKVLELIDNLLSELSEHSEEEFSVFFSRSVSKVSARKRNEFIQSSQLLPVWENFELLGLPRFNPFGKKNYEIINIPDLD
jgi:DNA mismatch repair protein MutL